ncbi:MAG: hypothetical protein JWQ34_3053 [Mucilaginibacter sp.]|nr:hypothetical protein [Mucilaginibacter sp.]
MRNLFFNCVFFYGCCNQIKQKRGSYLKNNYLVFVINAKDYIFFIESFFTVVITLVVSFFAESTFTVVSFLVESTFTESVVVVDLPLQDANEATVKATKAILNEFFILLCCWV